jgi:hypothetical protein
MLENEYYVGEEEDTAYCGRKRGRIQDVVGSVIVGKIITAHGCIRSMSRLRRSAWIGHPYGRSVACAKQIHFKL